MNKPTKRNRKHKIKNKTKKYLYGGQYDPSLNNIGITDVIGNTLSRYSSKATEYIKDKGSRLIGLGREDASTHTLVNDAKIIGDDVINVANKGSAAVIGNINEVLQSPQVGESITQAAKETADIGEKLLTNFNENISTPKLKAETKLAIENAADYIDIGLKAMDEPINNAIDELNKSAVKASAGLGSGIIKVGTDLMAAVPGVGAIVEVGKIMNDASTAIGNVVEATTDATSTISRVVEETSENMNKSMDELNAHTKIGNQILNRTNKSITDFENQKIIKGGYKTKRKLFKNKHKSKRVRFSI